MSARATVAGLDGRAVPFPIYVTTIPAWRAAEWDGTTEQPVTIEGYIARGKARPVPDVLEAAR